MAPRETKNGNIRSSSLNRRTLILSGSALVFATQTALMLTGLTENFDQGVLNWLHAAGRAPLGGVTVDSLVRDFTALGGWAILTWLMITSGLGLLLADCGGIATTVAMKALFGRERPDVPHRISVRMLSYPSGHALMSAACYLSLAYIARALTTHARLRTFWLATAITVGMLVGMSRVYLGVHFPSDVVAGWALGVAWATIGLSDAAVLQELVAGRPAHPKSAEAAAVQATAVDCTGSAGSS